jgi:hypothetical protein
MRGQQARACAGAPTDSYRLSAMAHPSRPFTHTTQPLRIVQCRRVIALSAANRRVAVVMFKKPHAKRQAQQITADVRASLRPWMRRQQARACAGAPTGSYRVSATAIHHDRSANSTQTKPLRSVHSLLSLPPPTVDELCSCLRIRTQGGKRNRSKQTCSPICGRGYVADKHVREQVRRREVSKEHTLQALADRTFPSRH